MANTGPQGTAAKVPSRAASLQRMLEMERKQKMERMQLQNPNLAPAPGRRGVSPASQTSSSTSSRGSGLLHRRRDSSQPRQQQQQQELQQSDDQRMPNVRNLTLPPLSIHTQPKKRATLMSPMANLSESKIPPQLEPRKPDRNTLPSMVRAATAGHEPSNLKVVAFAAEEANETDSSSICHSPTWDDYGKKKKKKQEKKEADTKRKRLTKGPPPAAMETRPDPSPRAVSDTTLSIHQLRQTLQGGHASEQPISTLMDLSIPLCDVESAASSPVHLDSFIGGVRLEREREAAMQRMRGSRASSPERPASEVIQSPSLESESITSREKRRETTPATISYPPTASKTPFSMAAPRTRRNSFSKGFKLAAGKLFGSKDKDSTDRSDSRASIDTIQTDVSSQERGRKMSGSSFTTSRGPSFDSHDHYAAEHGERRRGGASQPPETWKNSAKKSRTISMMAIPPNSARDGSFSPFHSPELKEDNFDFLDRPFSPPASVSASVQAEASPAPTPVSADNPVLSSRKTFTEALRAGFRSRSATPDGRSTRKRSGTLDTLIGTEKEITLAKVDSHPLKSHPVAAANTPALFAQGTGHSAEQMIGQARSGDSKDSADSSASSYPDSESLPPSPMTTPEGSRPQSKKDNQAFRQEEVVRAPPLSYANVIAMRGSPTLPPRQSVYLAPKKAEAPRVSVEKPSGPPKDLVGRQQAQTGSYFAEKSTPTQGFVMDELWSQTRRPLDPDQLSFTSALTNLDVKRSFTDLNSALQSPNGDVTPLSLEDASRGMAKKAESEEPKRSPMGFHFDLSNKSSTTSFSPSLPHQAAGPRVHERLPSNEFSQRSPHARVDSLNFPAPPVRKASDYLHEARKAAPASPRAPPLSSTASSPRASDLSQKPKQTMTTNTVNSPYQQQVRRQSVAGRGVVPAAADSSPLGTPISKMLVECCHCKFYHDMPSRVYEAMARPDDVVKDNRLGVSGQVTTCVKCPWCSHNMSTVCCAGYAAVVYLREKLHGS